MYLITKMTKKSFELVGELIKELDDMEDKFEDLEYLTIVGLVKMRLESSTPHRVKVYYFELPAMLVQPRPTEHINITRYEGKYKVARYSRSSNEDNTYFTFGHDNICEEIPHWLEDRVKNSPYIARGINIAKQYVIYKIERLSILYPDDWE